MSSTKTMPWVLGAAFLALAILAGAWLLLISPGLATAADSRQQAESEQSRVDQLQLQLVQLKKDYANLDEFKATLGALQTQIPPAADMTELTRQLSSMAAASGVFLTGIVPGTSLQVAPPAAAAPADGAATDGASGADASATNPAATDPAATDGAVSAPAPTGPVAPPNFYAIPVEIRLVGGYDETLAFIEQVQTVNPRLLLVTSLSLSGQAEDTAAQGGRPAMKAGDPETVVQAFAYVLADTPVSELDAPADGARDGAATDQPPAPAELPTPSGQANPFS